MPKIRTNCSNFMERKMFSRSCSLLLLVLLTVWQSKEHSKSFCHGLMIPNNNNYRYHSHHKSRDVLIVNNFQKLPITTIEPFHQKRKKIFLLWSRHSKTPMLKNSNNKNDTQTSSSSLPPPLATEEEKDNFQTLTKKEDDQDSFTPPLSLLTTTSRNDDGMEVVVDKEKEQLLSDWNIDMDNPRVELVSGLLVLFSSLLAAIETLPSLDIHFLKDLNNVQDVITVLFASEFILRWISYYNKNINDNQSKNNVLKYLWQPLSLVDMTSIWLPLVLSVMHIQTSKAALTNLRLLRILRLQRVLENQENFSNFIMATLPGMSTDGVRPYQLQLARVILSIFTLLSISTGFIYSAEHTVNPQIPDYFTALYFGLTTLTTVGFGDIAPVTFQGRLVVMGSILAGISIIPAQAANFVQALLDFQADRKSVV